MRHQAFIVKGQNILEPLSNFIKKYYRDSDDVFISEYIGGFLLAYEDYSFLNSNQLMVCVRLDSKAHANGIIKIEVLSGGGGGDMLLGDVFGSENRRISKFEDKLEEFCRENGMVVEV